MKFKASFFNYIFNTVNVMFAVVNGIIMVPLYLHYMPISTYGAWLASGNVIGLIGVVESGFSGVITQKMAVAYSQNDKTMFSHLATANFVVAAIMAMIIILGGLSICSFIPHLVNADTGIHKELMWAIIFSSLSTAFTVLFSLVGAIPQVVQETFYMGVINSLSIVFGIFITFLGLINHLGIISIALGYFARSFSNFIILSFHVRHLWFRYNFPSLQFIPSIVKELVQDCSIPFLARLSSAIVNNSPNLSSPTQKCIIGAENKYEKSIPENNKEKNTILTFLYDFF